MTRRGTHSLEAEAELREIRRLLRIATRKHPPLKRVELAQDWDPWLRHQIVEARNRLVKDVRPTSNVDIAQAALWNELDRLHWEVADYLAKTRLPRGICPDERQRREQARASDLARHFHLRVQRVANETGDMALRVLAGWFAYWAAP